MTPAPPPPPLSLHSTHAPCSGWNSTIFTSRDVTHVNNTWKFVFKCSLTLTVSIISPPVFIVSREFCMQFNICVCLCCFALKHLIVRDEKIILCVCGLPARFLRVFSEKEKTHTHILCLELFPPFFAVYSNLYYLQYLPDFSHKCILKQYYINHNITQRIGWRLSLECPHMLIELPKPAIEICSGYSANNNMPGERGSNLRGLQFRGWVKVLKHYQALFIAPWYARRNEMFCRFQAWSVFKRGGRSERIPSVTMQTAQLFANRIC